MGRPPTKEYKRPAKKFGRKEVDEDDDLEEIIADGEDSDNGYEEVDEEEIEEEEEEEPPPPPPRRARGFAPGPKPKTKFNARKVDVDEDENEVEEPAPKRPLRAPMKKPAARRVEVNDDEDTGDEQDEVYEDEQYEEDDSESAKSGPSWLTIVILVAIAGLFAAFVNLPILFFQNNPVLGIVAVVVVVACVVSYLRTDAEERDSFFLSGPGLLTLGALLCLFLGGLSEFNKEKQRVADEAEAAKLEQEKKEADAAAKIKSQQEAAQAAVPRPGIQGVSQGKWNITQDERGAYRVNGKKITGTWKLKADDDTIQFLSEEEKTEIRQALNKFDELNKKTDTQQ